ncbi:hypothetical protein MGH68_18500 [Erysipelothrix sp. D19-032]
MNSKKSICILCKGNRLSEYQFIKEHGKNFGVRWLCRKFKVSTNAYYNYLKQRKTPYYEQKAKVQRFISESFHRSNGTMGVKMMSYYCANHGYSYSLPSIRKYMKELNISSIIRRKKQLFKTGKQSTRYFQTLSNKIFMQQNQIEFGVLILLICT